MGQFHVHQEHCKTHSTTLCGLCVFSQIPFSRLEPHEIVFGHQPTLLASIKDREGTLGTSTPHHLLSTAHTGPYAQSNIFYLAEFVTHNFAPWPMSILKAQDVLSGHFTHTLFALSMVSSGPTSRVTCHTSGRSQPEFHSILDVLPTRISLSRSFLNFSCRSSQANLSPSTSSRMFFHLLVPFLRLHKP